MAFGKRKRNRFKFTEKKHSKKAIAATVLAIAILVLFGVFLVLAFQGNGNLSMYFGSVGVLAMLGALVTVVLSIQSMREEDSFPLFPRLSLGLSLLASFCWIGTYAMGILM